jgi:hypothetical protein
LSGLLTCGWCGGKYGLAVNDRYGCLSHFRKGTCDSGRTIRRGDIEGRVLAGLTDKLVSATANGSLNSWNSSVRRLEIQGTTNLWNELISGCRISASANDDCAQHLRDSALSFVLSIFVVSVAL